MLQDLQLRINTLLRVGPIKMRQPSQSSTKEESKWSRRKMSQSLQLSMLNCSPSIEPGSRIIVSEDLFETIKSLGSSFALLIFASAAAAALASAASLETWAGSFCPSPALPALEVLQPIGLALMPCEQA